MSAQSQTKNEAGKIGDMSTFQIGDRVVEKPEARLREVFSDLVDLMDEVGTPFPNEPQRGVVTALIEDGVEVRLDPGFYHEGQLGGWKYYYHELEHEKAEVA